MNLSLIWFAGILAGGTALSPGQTQACAWSVANGCSTIEPYAAKFKITDVRVLADGTTITRESLTTQARDSAGRTAYVTTMVSGSGDGKPSSVAVVKDPTAGAEIIWQSRLKQASVIEFPPPDQRHGCWRAESGALVEHYPSQKSDSDTSDPQPSATDLPPSLAAQRRDLGTSIMNGVEVNGVQVTTTIPAGESGNDRPLVTTFEYWQAPSLGLTLRSVHSDPRDGTVTKELVSLDRGEPDPALFQPPEGYEVITQKMIPCAE